MQLTKQVFTFRVDFGISLSSMTTAQHKAIGTKKQQKKNREEKRNTDISFHFRSDQFNFLVLEASF